MNSNPVLTVITPTYNRADFLAETIESVLSQDFFDIEYIIIDDGSKDNTFEVVSRYLPRQFKGTGNLNIRYYRHDNIGETRTVNKALMMVRGEFFTVVNSDDPLVPGSFTKVIEALRRSKQALAAYPDWQVIDEHSNVLSTIRLIGYDVGTLFTHGHVSIGPGACFKREALELVGYRNPLLRYSADLDYWYRLALIGPLVHVPEALATHRIHPASASVSDRGTRLADETAHLFSAYCRHPLLKPQFTRLTRIADAHGIFASIFTCSNLRQASRRLAKSIVVHPMAGLKRWEKAGPREIARFFTVLGGRRNGSAEGVFDKLRQVQARADGVSLLVRGILNDPIGMLELAEEEGLPKISNRIRSLPLYRPATATTCPTVAGSIDAATRLR